jgi:hypothetical protein
MKKFQRLCAATTLLFVLSLSALAGTIHTNAVEQPSPPPASATATEPGADTTDGTQNPVDSETVIAEITLSLLQLLTVF